jgi:toxin YoeB
MYKIIFLPEAEEDMKVLKKNEPLCYKKLYSLLHELELHPTTGTGHPKPMGGDRAGQWSRRISQKHRLVYKIQEEVVTVLILTAYGHYEDK